jgi:hypothetical protein
VSSSGKIAQKRSVAIIISDRGLQVVEVHSGDEVETVGGLEGGLSGEGGSRSVGGVLAEEGIGCALR